MKTSTLRAMVKGDPPRGNLPQRYDLALEVIRLREALAELCEADADGCLDDAMFKEARSLLAEHDE